MEGEREIVKCGVMRKACQQCMETGSGECVGPTAVHNR